IANLVIAAWCLYSDTHSSQQSQSLEVIDDMAETLQQAAHASRISPLAFLEQPSIFGSIIENESFCNEYKYYISKLYAGVAIEHIMEALLNNYKAK
ncbi:MAG: mannitol dehydrogenase family protein, partial [Pseudoalteromonas shioyasakiensis]